MEKMARRVGWAREKLCWLRWLRSRGTGEGREGSADEEVSGSLRVQGRDAQSLEESAAPCFREGTPAGRQIGCDPSSA